MKTKITIEGMHCASCATNIERALKKLPGINEVVVSVLTKKATVESEKPLNQEEVKKLVSKVGYKVTNFE